MRQDDPDAAGASPLGRLSQQQADAQGAEPAADALVGVRDQPTSPYQRHYNELVYGPQTWADIPEPPANPGTTDTTRPTPDQPQTLHDYSAMARRPISANVEDRRFEETSNPWLGMLKYINRRGRTQPQQAPSRVHVIIQQARD